MPTHSNIRKLHAGLALCAALFAGAPMAATSQADALLKQYASHKDKLASSALGGPIVVDSAELPDGLRGDVYAVIDHPFEEVRATLLQPEHWCEMLLLHIDNRRCVLGKAPGGKRTVQLSVVRSYEMPVTDAFVLGLEFKIDRATSDFLSAELDSPDGPLGTSNHHFDLDAVALSPTQTFLRMTYAYDHNVMAKYATQAYLATFGSDKVGFTVEGKDAGGAPQYIRGLRGLVERNVMRYFLALDAYLSAMSAPPAQQSDARFERWYTLSERYPRQLHEVDQATYMANKRADRARDAAK